MKPLATLGEVSGVNWRAQLRANDIQRRVPPPSERASRPDRGYVEQPEERVKVTTSTQPTARRIVSFIPLADLEREQLQDLSDELGEPLDEPSIAAIADSSSKAERASGVTQRFSANPNPPPLLQPQPETQPSVPAKIEPEYVRLARQERELMVEESEMPPKRRKEREFFDAELRVKGVEAVLAQERLQGGPIKGTIVSVARRMKIPGNNLSNWVKLHKLKHGDTPPSALQTMASSGVRSAPATVSPSGLAVNGHAPPVSVSNGQLPPPPTVVLAGLEEYIKALVDQRIAAAFRRVQGMAD